MDINLLVTLLLASGYALVAFYAIVLFRGLAAFESDFRSRSRGLESNSSKSAKLSFLIFVFGGFISYNMWNDRGLDKIYKLILVQNAVILLMFFSFLVAVAPHFIIGIEFRRRRPNGWGAMARALVAIVIALFSLPALMTVMTYSMALVYGAFEKTEYHRITDPLPWLFDVPKKYGDSDITNMAFFWMNESFQASLFGIPEVFGIEISSAEHNSSNIFMSILVVSYRSMLSILSLYMIFGIKMEKVLLKMLKISIGKYKFTKL